MECHFPGQLKEKFIKELSEVNPPSSVRVVKLTDVAQLQIELVTLCSIPCLEELLDMIASSLWSILQWI